MDSFGEDVDVEIDVENPLVEGVGGLGFSTIINDGLDALGLTLNAQGINPLLEGVPVDAFSDFGVSNYGEDGMTNSGFSIIEGFPKVSSFLPGVSSFNFMTNPLGAPHTGSYRNKIISNIPQASSIFDPDDKIATQNESAVASIIDALNGLVNASLLQRNPSFPLPVAGIAATEPSSHTYFTNIHFSILPLPLPRPLDSKNEENFTSGEGEPKPVSQLGGQSHKQECNRKSHDIVNSNPTNANTHSIVVNVTNDKDYAINIHRELTMFDVLKLFISSSTSKGDRNETQDVLNSTSVDEDGEEQPIPNATMTVLTTAATPTTATAPLWTGFQLPTVEEEKVEHQDESTQSPDEDDVTDGVVDAMNATSDVSLSNEGAVNASDDFFLDVSQSSVTMQPEIGN